MEINRKITIITDSAASTQYLAEGIAAAIENGSFSSYSVSILHAEQFSGTDLLPAHAIFLGCEEPKPSSFFYIEELFEHINLAGRLCGIFSVNAKAIKYLSAIVSASETVVSSPLLAKNGTPDAVTIQNWIQNILKQGKQ